MVRNTVYPCIWTNHQNAEMSAVYGGAFDCLSVLSSTPFVTELALGDYRMLLLDGGDKFSPNPSISIFIKMTDKAALQKAWDKLTEGAKVMMPLQAWPWSPMYGWVKDRFNVSWQLFWEEKAEEDFVLSPCLMYVGDNAGKTKDAMDFYCSMFKPSVINGVTYYGEGGGDVASYINHAEFTLGNNLLMAMDSSHMHGFDFSEGISLVVPCKNQEEIDHYWASLTNGGAESICGWLKDRYGVSWQIVSANIGILMSDQEKAPKIFERILKMKKIIVADLESV